MIQLVNNLSYLAGSHTVKLGADFIYNDLTITYPRSVRGSYAFSSLANFLTGAYSSTGFTQTFGDSIVAQTNPNAGLYLQDEWHATGALTVNAGLRYDAQVLETIETDSNNFSPRLGLAWSPYSSRQVVVRASLGRFYDRIPLRAVANALLSAGNSTDLSMLRQIGVTLSPSQVGAPTFPSILPAFVPTATLVNLTTMDRRIQNAFSDQASLELERQLGAAGTVSVSYQHIRGRSLMMAVNQNVPTCLASGTNNGCRPNSSYANNTQYSSVGSSDYNGLQFSIIQRPTSWFNYRLSYAFSKSMNNVGEAFFSSPIDPADISKDWARSDDDQRHRLTLLLSVSTPATPGATVTEKLTHGFQVSTFVQAYSALPYNITTGGNTVQGTAARPTLNGTFIPRNSGQGSPFSTFNIRIERSLRVSARLKVQALLEVFNVFNRRNDVARNTVFGMGAYPSSPALSFGQVTVVGDPRSAQFGFRVSF